MLPDSNPHHHNGSPASRWLTLLAASVLLCARLPAQELDSLLKETLQPHHDRLEGMAKRREIRALVHWSKTDYFIERGQQLRIAAEMARDFEKFLNKELKTGRKPIRLIIVPVSRDKLIDYLVEGRGDISFTGMRETPELHGRVSFSVPIYDNVSEIVMRTRSAPAIRSENDLAGKTVHLRPSSKYLSTLKQINRRLRAPGLPRRPIMFYPAP
jgi:ABC-type amino acid transport substrate-binding protein